MKLMDKYEIGIPQKNMKLGFLSLSSQI